jgi:hypothetical protein
MREIFAQKKYCWHKKVGTRKLKKMQCFFNFFLANFRILATKKKLRMVERYFFGFQKMRKSPYFDKKEVTSCHILKKNNSKVTIFK